MNIPANRFEITLIIVVPINILRTPYLYRNRPFTNDSIKIETIAHAINKDIKLMDCERGWSNRKMPNIKLERLEIDTANVIFVPSFNFKYFCNK